MSAQELVDFQKAVDVAFEDSPARDKGQVSPGVVAIGFNDKVSVGLVEFWRLVSLAREKLAEGVYFDLMDLLEAKPDCGAFGERRLSFDLALEFFFLLKVQVNFGKLFGLIDYFFGVWVLFWDDWGYFGSEPDLLDEAIGDFGVGGLGRGSLGLFGFGGEGGGLLEGVEGVATGMSVEVDDEGGMCLHLEYIKRREKEGTFPE